MTMFSFWSGNRIKKKKKKDVDVVYFSFVARDPSMFDSLDVVSFNWKERESQER